MIFPLAKARRPAKQIPQQAERTRQWEENKREIPFSGGLYKIWELGSRRISPLRIIKKSLLPAFTGSNNGRLNSFGHRLSPR
jgi:hypothetical protein